MKIFCTGNPNKKKFYRTVKKVALLTEKNNHELIIDSNIDSPKLNLNSTTFNDFLNKEELKESGFNYYSIGK